LGRCCAAQPAAKDRGATHGDARLLLQVGNRRLTSVVVLRIVIRIAQFAAVLATAGVAFEGVAQAPRADPGKFHEISFQTSDGGLIFGNLYGEGAHAVVLAHGAAFNKESWDELATRLSDEGYRVLAIDFRGYGKSTTGRRRGALYEDILGAIRYLREQGATQVSVIGASMGGGAAGDAAARARPGEIDRLILLAAVAAESPERMQGKKLFIVSREDGIRPTVERQFNAAAEPKELKILEGSAHAQHIFRTARAGELTEAILSWLAGRP
jgi:dienelactone hydrolase